MIRHELKTSEGCTVVINEYSETESAEYLKTNPDAILIPVEHSGKTVGDLMKATQAEKRRRAALA